MDGREYAPPAGSMPAQPWTDASSAANVSDRGGKHENRPLTGATNKVADENADVSPAPWIWMRGVCLAETLWSGFCDAGQRAR